MPVLMILLSAFLLPAFAVDSQRPLYDEARRQFEDGVKPKAKDLLGFHIGRCYHRSVYDLVTDGRLFGKAEGEILNARTSFTSDFEVGKYDDLSYGQLVKFFGEGENALDIRETEDRLLVDNIKSSDQVVTWEVRKDGINGNILFRLGTKIYCIGSIHRKKN
jgi:hypothetical protein